MNLAGDGYGLAISSLGLSTTGGTGETTAVTANTVVTIGAVTNPMTSFASNQYDNLQLQGSYAAIGGTVTGVISDSATGGIYSGGYTQVTMQNGYWTLGGANTYTGNTILNGGQLALTSTGTLGIQTSPGVLQFNGGGLDTAGNTIANAVTLTSNMNLGGVGATFNGMVTLSNNNYVLGDNASGVTTLAGGVTLNNYTLTPESSGSITISGSISGSGGLTLDNTGVMTLSGNNSYNGATNLNSGTLALNSGGALGYGTLSIGAATLDNTSGAPVTEYNNPAVTINGNFNFGGSNSLNLGTGNVTINNAPNNVTQHVINLDGDNANTLTLGGTYTQGGSFTLTVNNGPDAAGESLVFGSTGYNFNLSNSGTGYTATFAGNGNVTINSSIVNSNGGSPNRALAYSGFGTLSLTGYNSYSGSTTISNGAVDLLSGSISASSLTVNAGGSFVESLGAGYGSTNQSITIRGGAVTLGGTNNSYTGNTAMYYGSLTYQMGSSSPFAGGQFGSTTSTQYLGGTFTVLGTNNNSYNDTQIITNTQLLANTSSQIIANQNGDNSLYLTFTNFTRNGETTVDFTLPATTGTITMPTSLSDGATKGNILTAGTNGVAFATVGGQTWATNSATGVVGALPDASYATGAANYTTNNNIDVGAGGSPDSLSSNFTVNTLRFNTPGADATLTLGSAVVGNIYTGGILVTSNAGAATISGGTLKPNANEFEIINNGSLTINSVLANNGTSNVVIASPNGQGVTTLAGANTYTGETSVDTSATLVLTGSITNNGSVVVAPYANFFETSTGSISGTSGLTLQNGAGQVILAGANTFTGATNLAGGSLMLENANALQNSTLTFNSGNLELRADANTTFANPGIVVTGTTTIDAGSLTSSGGNNTLTLGSVAIGNTTGYTLTITNSTNNGDGVGIGTFGTALTSGQTTTFVADAP